MSVTGPHINRYGGGLCYALCQDTFSFYNPSTNMCWKGCDFATGRVNDPELRWISIYTRKEAESMCRRYTSEVMVTERGELECMLTCFPMIQSIFSKLASQAFEDRNIS